MATMTERMIGAASLNAATYEEVEADTTATGQAMAVVALSSLAAGLGNIVSGGIIGVIAGVIAALIGWGIWAAVTYIIGTKILPEPQTKADFGQMLRCLGFASAPGVLRVLGIIPFLGVLINLVVAFWMHAATVVAVRQALDYKSTLRAVGVCVIGWLAMMAVMVAFAVFMAGAAAIGGAVT